MTSTETAATATTHVAMGITSDATLGYASYRNHVPPIRVVTVQNPGDRAISMVDIEVSVDPPIADTLVLRFERLEAGESRRIAPVDLKCRHDELASLTESIRGAYLVVARTNGIELGRAGQDVEILAYDQWAGMRGLPEMLAAFCVPNDPVVDRHLRGAAEVLRVAGQSLNGYQSGEREQAARQVAAIYSALVAQGLAYCNPPASFLGSGQKIRLPERIADAKIATCLDTAMLFASCIEQAGMGPMVLLSKTHAWVAFWLVDKTPPSPVFDDIQDIRKMVAAGEMLAIETTGIFQNPAPSFREACARGAQQLEAQETVFFGIDIRAARARQVLPIASRAVAPPPQDAGTPAGAPPITELPDLPPVAPTEPILVVPEGAHGRILKWENKLLDLTLRNRLLNFRDTKGTIPLIVPAAGEFEDALSVGATFRILGNPHLMKGTDPRDAVVHRDRTGQDALQETAKEMFERKQLLSSLEQDDLDGRLLEVFYAAKTSLEEGGSNTLFVAMGTLIWDDATRGAKKYRAPLVLVPVTLKRQTVRGGFSLERHDDEALVNPTLLQMLRQDSQLEIDGLANLTRDDSGIDVDAAWQAFRKAVAEIKGWEVRPDVFLGNFSFTKYLMWKDLHSRKDELKKNRVVSHLIDTPDQPYADAAEVHGKRHDLDREFTPQQLITPLICDSSQLQAIAHAAAGRDIVLDGPPGTGKSQTIANAIAHFLGEGKTVLFVSEKIAALNVVHDRLNKMRLGPFCLELHSAKAQKSAVVKQLNDTLNFAQTQSAESWEHRANQLAARRQELNDFVHLLHREHRNGLTVYAASGIRLLHGDWIPATFSWADPDVHDRTALDDLRELMERICALATHFPNLQARALDGVGQTDYREEWADKFAAGIEALRSAIVKLQAEAEAIEHSCGFEVKDESVAGLAAFSTFISEFTAAAGMPAGLAAKPFDRESRETLREVARHGKARNAAWAAMGGFAATVATLTASNLQANWAAAEATWWPKSALARRELAGILMAHRTDRKRPGRDVIPSFLANLATLNTEDAAIERASLPARLLLGDKFAGIDTDWAVIEPMVEWAERLEAACDRFGGTDLEAIGRIRAQVTALLATHQRLLAPGEALARGFGAYQEAYVAFSERLRALEELAVARRPIAGEPSEPGALARGSATLERWTSARGQLRPWCIWQGLRSEALAKGVDGIVQALEAGSVSLGKVRDFFEYSYHTWWLKRVIDRESVLRNFTGTDQDRKVAEFRRLDTEFQDLSVRYIIAKAAQRIPNANARVIAADSEVGKLRREAQRQRGHMPIRQLLQQMPTLLTRLKPCMLMSPLSVAQYLDATQQLFDVVIFDEASQIPVWDAVGAIARGRQLLVAGDPKQLPPTSFFQKTGDDDAEGVTEADGSAVVEDLESMLDECLAAGLPQQRLLWHYRSRHESLITFSNHQYYGGGLITFPSPVTEDRAVQLIPVKGHYDRGASKTNRAEADAIVAEIEQHYLSGNKLSVGVVTFNQVQQQLIQRLLDERRGRNDRLDRAIAAAEDEPIFVKNLENVQGDERDVILFSVTYGPDAAGSVAMNFGPLNQQGGHRRLNVAITRARHAVKIFSTLQPEQIDLGRTQAQGVQDLKTYLEFAKKGPAAILERSTPTGREPDSPFEVAVLAALRERGWIVHPQVGCSCYRIDMAVVNPHSPGEYLIGVECDGRTYHSSATARDRDRLRQMVLEGLGWRLHRIWSTDWWHDPDREIERLHQVLGASAAEARQPRPEKSDDEGASGNPPAAEPSSSAPPEPVRARATVVAPTPRVPAGEQPAIYQPFTVGSVYGDFYEESSTPLLRRLVMDVINAEGPIREEDLFRRIARAWGLDRVGRQIAFRLHRVIPTNCRSDDGEGVFYWPEDVDRRAWRGMRACKEGVEASNRHIADVSIEEMANLAAWALSANGQMEARALARCVCQLIGMQRAKEDALKRALRGVNALCASGRATRRDDYVAPVLV